MASTSRKELCIGKNQKSCFICQKSFSTSAQTLEHIQNEHGPLNCPCTRCSRKTDHHKFMMKTSARDGDRNVDFYKCRLCSAAFIAICRCLVHCKESHVSHPFECAVCNTSYKSHVQLSTHMATHLQDGRNTIIQARCFYCKNGGKTITKYFRRPVDLYRHMVDDHNFEQEMMARKKLNDGDAMFAADDMPATQAKPSSHGSLSNCTSTDDTSPSIDASKELQPAEKSKKSSKHAKKSKKSSKHSKKSKHTEGATSKKKSKKCNLPSSTDIVESKSQKMSNSRKPETKSKSSRPSTDTMSPEDSLEDVSKALEDKQLDAFDEIMDDSYGDMDFNELPESEQQNVVQDIQHPIDTLSQDVMQSTDSPLDVPSTNVEPGNTQNIIQSTNSPVETSSNKEPLKNQNTMQQTECPVDTPTNDMEHGSNTNDTCDEAECAACLQIAAAAQKSQPPVVIKTEKEIKTEEEDSYPTYTNDNTQCATYSSTQAPPTSQVVLASDLSTLSYPPVLVANKPLVPAAASSLIDSRCTKCWSEKSVTTVCHPCAMVFLDPDVYTLHKLWHDRENPYRCSQCGKDCGSRYLFTTHIFRDPHP